MLGPASALTAEQIAGDPCQKCTYDVPMHECALFQPFIYAEQCKGMPLDHDTLDDRNLISALRDSGSVFQQIATIQHRRLAVT
jgi:hypothetical protein